MNKKISNIILASIGAQLGANILYEFIKKHIKLYNAFTVSELAKDEPEIQKNIHYLFSHPELQDIEPEKRKDYIMKMVSTFPVLAKHNPDLLVSPIVTKHKSGYIPYDVLEKLNQIEKRFMD